ncbi:hypothetical protein JTE90_000868 [Oedothorax gibbosus]|uniref:Uncharacterized protein n=1 Tax=Oedothorax gibbosus TaxID=931172 RepID=A0AAV6VUL1_9ARAC|nr:hypothetical protein JTE90_000868 [Oedothorax gibbosus]
MMQAGDFRESELQKLLTDERDRSNQYKRIYETLKEEHITLRKELTFIHDKLKNANDQNEKLRSDSDANVRKLESRVKEQQNEINILNERLKSYDDKRIQIGAFEEATSHYEAKIKELNDENDKIRDQYNNLHYENAILKCKFESRESEYSRALERINLQHQGEMDLLQTKIEAIEKERTLQPETYALELKSSKREVLQLNSRVKDLLSECEELRTQNENLSVQINSITRTNAKQLSDHLTNIRLLESEKQKATTRMEVLEKELINVQEHKKALNSELQSSKLQIQTLKRRIEECEHNYRQVKTNLQVEIEQWKSTKESQQEEYVDAISRLKSELQSLSSNIAQERQTLLTKEQELHEKVSIERQHFWKQTREQNQEKEKLQNVVKELEAVTVSSKQEVHELKQKLQRLVAEKVELEKEVLATRKNTGTRNEQDGFAITRENDSKRNLDYEKAIQELKERIDLLSAGNSVASSDHEITRLKLSWEQQKLQYQQRIEELESQLREFKTSTAAEKRELEFKNNQYQKKFNSLREKYDHQKLLTEESENHKETLQTAHFQLQKQLAELQRRMEEYRVIIATDPNVPSKDTPGLTFPERMLADIKNIPFRTFLPGTASTPTVSQDSTRKPLQPRRKSIKARDRLHQMKSATPVISSSSDLENL